MGSGCGTSNEVRRKRSKGRTSDAKTASVCAPLSTTAAGVEVEHGYEPTDRLLRTLFLAVCRSMNLEAYEDPTRSPAMLFVTAPMATQDALAARIEVLAPQLDEQLMALTARFIREHCGLDVPIRPRT